MVGVTPLHSPTGDDPSRRQVCGDLVAAGFVAFCIDLDLAVLQLGFLWLGAGLAEVGTNDHEGIGSF